MECFSYAPVWLRIHALPLELWNHVSVSLIANSIGKLITIDNRSFEFQKGKYVRVCVEIDLAQSIKQGVLINLHDSKFFQPIVYENLPSVCFKCGIIGHREVSCLDNKCPSVDNANHVEVNHDLTENSHSLNNVVKENTTSPK
ncbi:hypothetical protein Cni_G14589 [Canna indica]|uniref:CCHC-type domain-containing protein n=1 Tax=Canna indica TaxID=4628 RepID=A0AAQ3KFD3_9LILI|nr:hypothetical protein Cni_G14589 [Canna indica]